MAEKVLFKELKAGTVFVFKERLNTLHLLSFNHQTNRNDVVLLSGNFHNAGQLYEGWADKEVIELPYVKKTLQSIAHGISGS
jgi:hypothetical protein